MTQYKSSVMRTNLCEEDCPTCNYLNGKRDTATCEKVIENLDSIVADYEETGRQQLYAFQSAGDAKDAIIRELLGLCVEIDNGQWEYWCYTPVTTTAKSQAAALVAKYAKRFGVEVEP